MDTQPLSVCLVLALLCSTPASAQVVGPTDYVAYWSLDEGAGTLAMDASANAFSGLVSGAQWTNGVSGSALEFDGVDDFVELTDGSGHPDLLATLSVGTISVWFRFDSAPPNSEVHPIFELGNGVLGNDHSGLILEVGHFLSDTKLFFTIYEAGHVIPQCFDTGFSLQPGRWYHFAAVVGPGYNTGYLDGVELTGRHYNYGGPTDDDFFIEVPGPQVAWLGRGRLANVLIDQHHDGAIDELRIYDRPLDAAEIQGYYRETLGGAWPPGPSHCEVRSAGAPLSATNPIAPGLAQVSAQQVDVVILGGAESVGLEAYLQPLLDSAPPLAGGSFQVVNLAFEGGEAWRWATPGEEGHQRIETLLQGATNPIVVLGLLSNSGSYPILLPNASDPNHARFVGELLTVADSLHTGGSAVELVYLSAHRYDPTHFVACWNENVSMEDVMLAAAASGAGYLKPGPELHDLSWCCHPSCFAPDGVGPGASGRQQMAEAWHALLVREFTGIGELCRGSLNSSGTRATLSSAGSTSLASNDLVLAVDGAVPGQFGVIFYAAGRNLLPFGDGVLCLAGQFHRVRPALAADGLGQASRSIDNTRAPMAIGSGALLPGSSWNFQFWYRDPAAAGAGFNVSSALSVTFQP